MPPQVSVVVPCHNEGANLAPLLARLVPALEGSDATRDYEVVIVDDNSADQTGILAEEAARANPRIRVVHRTHDPGFGLAIRAGLATARGAVVVPFMGDLSDDPSDVPRLVDAVSGTDAQVAYGSRFVRQGDVGGYPYAKLAANRAYNLVLRLAFGVKHRDITNAFKAYRREVLDAIGLDSLESSGFELTAELPLKAHILGFRAVEVPVTWHGRIAGSSKLRTMRMGPSYARRFLSLFLLGNLLGLADLFRAVLRGGPAAFVGGILLGFLMIGAVFQAFSPGDVVGVLRTSSWRWFALAAGLALGALALRVWRWSVLLRASGNRIGRESVWRCILFSWFINYLLPFRAGDVARALAVRAIEPVSVGGALGTIAVERAMDLLALAAFLVVGAALLGGVPSLDLLLLGGVGLFLLLALGLVSLRFAGDRIARVLRTRSARFAVLVEHAGSVVTFIFANPPATALSLVLSVIIWATEASTVYASARAVGLDIPYVVAVAAGSAAFLVQAVPNAPGGFGLHEAGITGVLVALGVPATGAAAASLLDHAARAVVVFTFGGIATIHLGFQSRAFFRERRASREARNRESDLNADA